MALPNADVRLKAIRRRSARLDVFMEFSRPAVTTWGSVSNRPLQALNEMPQEDLHFPATEVFRMKRQLVVIAGPDQGKISPLEDGQTLVIGRGQASDTRIQDSRMSRIHCRVQVDGGKLLLIDGGSASGTLVDGEPITQRELNPGGF